MQTVPGDRDLLFGMLARQVGLLEAAHFAEACNTWALRQDTPLGNLCVERGWLTPTDREHVEYLVQRLLEKQATDSHATQTDQTCVAGPDSIGDPELQHRLSRLGAQLAGTVTSGNRGRYTLTRRFAQGGIGRIWLARDHDLGREIALKELHPERADNPSLSARFLAEARITGQLEHPSIVPVYELSQSADGHAPFYTMRFVKGRTLKQAARDYHQRQREGSAGPLELHGLLGSFVAVCNAVAYAHARGVLHRDLKGANIVLGDYGEVIVLDWGLAKVMNRKETHDELEPVLARQGDSTEETVQGQTVGTPGYMAPEQALGQIDQLDERSDVYGLGAVLYEILTGRAPYVGPDPQELLRRVVKEPPAPPSSLAPGTAPALEGICLKALAKDPAARYPSVRELAEEIRQWLAGEPVSAYPEPLWARLRRWLGKHRTVATATAATLLVATITLGLATVLLQQARGVAEQNLHAAEANLRDAEENFALARAAVDQSFTAISESPQLRAHGLEQLRKRLLSQARKYYEHFVQVKADRPELQAERGRAYRRLAEMTAATGDRPEAIRICQQACGVFTDLLNAEPEADAYRDDLAQVLSILAENYRLSRQIPEAGAVFEEAVAERQQLVERHPDVDDYRYRLAVSLRDLGDFYQLEANKLPQSEATCKKALALCEPLARGHPAKPDYQYALARAYSTLAGVQTWTQPPEVGRANFNKALAEYAALVHEHPDVPAYFQRQAEAYNDLGILLSNKHRMREAKPVLEQAIHIRERLVEEHPDVVQYAQELADSRTVYAGTIAELGDYARAARLVDEALSKAPAGYPLAQYNGACTYVACLTALRRAGPAVTAEGQKLAEQYGARAVALLRQAQRMGFFNGPSRLEEMKADPDLAPLRERADYRQLVRELDSIRKKNQGGKVGSGRTPAGSSGR